MPDPRPARGPSPHPAATHACAARGCGTQVPRRLLMCRTHWSKVPADIRASIWLAYRPGQEHDARPSEAYLSAVTEAIQAVANHGRRAPNR